MCKRWSRAFQGRHGEGSMACGQLLSATSRTARVLTGQSVGVMRRALRDEPEKHAAQWNGWPGGGGTVSTRSARQVIVNTQRLHARHKVVLGSCESRAAPCTRFPFYLQHLTGTSAEHCLTRSSQLLSCAPEVLLDRVATFARPHLAGPCLLAQPPADGRRHHTPDAHPANQAAQTAGRFRLACRGHHTLCFIAPQPIVARSGAFGVVGLHPQSLALSGGGPSAGPALAPVTARIFLAEASTAHPAADDNNASASS